MYFAFILTKAMYYILQSPEEIRQCFPLRQLSYFNTFFTATSNTVSLRTIFEPDMVTIATLLQPDTHTSRFSQ